MQLDIVDLILFIRKSEKLKTITRHSWLSDSDRQESVAEHTWMMCLIAISVFDSIDHKVDQLKVLKMITVHDLAEAVTGDIPTFEKSERKNNKLLNEQKALKGILSELPKKLQEELTALWLEYENNETKEAKLVQCIDKIEVLIQHNIADIKTWDEGDYKVGTYNRDHYFDHDSYMRKFKDHVIELYWQKLEESGTLSMASQEDQTRRNKGMVE